MSSFKEPLSIGDVIEVKHYPGRSFWSWEVVDADETFYHLRVLTQGYVSTHTDQIGSVSKCQRRELRSDLTIVTDGLDKILKKI